MLRARLATAAVAIPLLLLLIYLAPRWLFAAFIGVVGVAGVLEYVGMAFPMQRLLQVLGVLLGLVLMVAAALGPGPGYMAALASALAAGLIWSFLGGRDLQRGLSDVGLLFVGLLYVGLFLPHFIWVRQLEQGPHWVVFVVAICMLGDSSGYFIGRAWGERKLIPHVSPGKTVAGSAGILLGSVVGALGTKVLLLRDLGWIEATVLGFVLGVLAQLGDLTESVMKRSFGAKESGWIFPGHGGVLDRIDSLLFPISFVYYYAVLAR